MFIDTAITHPASITLTIAKGGKSIRKKKTRRRKHKYNRKTLRKFTPLYI